MRKYTASIKSGRRGIPYAMLAAVFMLAQLFVIEHHFGEAHADDGPDEHIVECDICTIASGAVDNAPAIGNAETPTIRPSELPSQSMEVARQGSDRPGGPRAPPQTH